MIPKGEENDEKEKKEKKPFWLLFICIRGIDPGDC